MHKVRNRRVLRLIADRTRKAGKGKSLIAVLAISLTTVLFTSVFTIGGSMIQKQQEETMRQVGGSAHAGYKYLTQEEYDIVKRDPEIKEISYRIAVGDAVNEKLRKLRTEISYYEELDAKFSFCYPEEGWMPEKEDEIVLSDLTLKALELPCELGIQVPLVIQTGKETYEKTFTLCGYFQGDRISQSQVGLVSREHADKMTPTPTDSVMGKGADVSEYAGRLMADFNFATSFQIEKQVEELSRRCGFPENVDAGVNWAYMGDLDPEVILLIGSLLLVILVSGYLIIYNIFYINVYQDIRYYGLLKTVGTTEKQLQSIVRRQACMLSLYGIPAGLLLGALVGKVLLPVIMGNLTFSGTTNTEVVLNPWIFIGAAVFSFMTVLLSVVKPCRIASRVSAVEAVRYTEGQETAPEKTKRKHGKREERLQRAEAAETGEAAVKNRSVEKESAEKRNARKKEARYGEGKKPRRVHPRELALRNVRRNKKKVVIVVASLSLSLVLLNCIYGFLKGFDMDRFVSSMTVSDFSVADATLDNVSVSLASVETEGVTEEFLSELERQEGVEEIGKIYMKWVDPVFSEENYTLLEERILGNEKVRETLEWYGIEVEMAEENFRRENYLDGKVFGIDEMVMEKLENPEGTLDWEKFSGGDYVIATRFDKLDGGLGIDFFRPGEKVTVTNAEGETREYEVLAVADLPYACELQHYGVFECNFILPEEAYQDFIGRTQPMRTLFNVEAEREAAVEAWLADYCENVNPDLLYTSKSTIVAEFDEYKNMYAMVGGILVLILAMIGILNFINTMITSVLSRKQEFAMMEAVGMTAKQLKQMLCYEGGYYAVYTGACALLLGSFLSVTAVRMIGEGYFFFRWHFTVAPVLLCLPVLGLIVYCVPALCYKNMSRTSVVERMRRAE